MSVQAFIVTNVLVYAFDADEPPKRRIALELLSAKYHRLVVSAQVLAEFYVTVTRRLARTLPPYEAAERVADLSRLTVVPISAALIGSAVVISREAAIPFWDAAIVAAAAPAGCEQVLSEDIQASGRIAGVQITNPFSGARR